MNKFKRKPFFIKGNFQLIFIIFFIALLIFEVSGAVFFIYKFSSRKIETTVYSGHFNIKQSNQIIKPIVIKVNLYVLLISIFASGLAILIAYFKLRILFSEIIEGVDKLKDNHTSFRLKMHGTKNTRELIKEFNQTAAYLDKKGQDLTSIAEVLSTEKDLKQISRLHNKLYSLLSSQNYY